MREFPSDAKADAGHQIHQLEQGEQPSDFKPMASIGVGVQEIRVRGIGGAYRVIYIAGLVKVIYILHAFQKTTQATALKDIQLARQRYKELIGDSQ